MRRTSRLALALAASATLLAAPACQRQRDEIPKARQRTAIEREQVAAGTAADIPALETVSYARTLVEQLDLVGADADGYLVIRDLRPLIAQARRVEQVMAGPLARAIPALAELGGGTGQARLEQLERARELLALVLAGLEGSGVALEQGMVMSMGQRQPVVAFAAADPQRLAALASLADASFDLATSCASVSESPGWIVCSLGGPEPLERYVPANQGQALAARLADRMGGATLEYVNVALSLVSSETPIDATLRTDPGLWELTVPISDRDAAPDPNAAPTQLLREGSAPALRALVPGTSFVWARVDPAALGLADAAVGPIGPDLLTGELWFGAVDHPSGLIAQAGIHDASAAASGLSALAGMLPATTVEPEQLPGLCFDFDRASIDLEGSLVPSIGVNVSGDAAQPWAATLGTDLRARVWAHGDHLSVALGEVQAIPAALARLEGTGPSPAALAGLPPTLAHALLAGEVALVMHVVLDHWQAPPSEAELQALLGGLPATSRPSSTAITALFQGLAPWSTMDLWVSRGPSTGQRSSLLAHLSVVPFGVPGAGVDPAEVAAAEQVLDAVLAGADAQAGYRGLLSRFPSSPRAPSYRARVGDAPNHHAAIGMVELGLVAAVAIPAASEYLSQANTTEATSQTQTILSAALRVHEDAGSCESLLGHTEVTPPLSVACHEGVGGRCRASDSAEGLGRGGYLRSAWTTDPIWAAIGYQPSSPEGHRYHYEVQGDRERGGGCRITVRAFGDLDADGLYSTYERVATITPDGAQTLTPLRIELGSE